MNYKLLEDIQALPDISLSLVVISHAVFSLVVPRVTTSYDDTIRYHSSRSLYVFFCSHEYKYKPFDSIRAERDHPARSNRQHTVTSLLPLSLSQLDLVEYTSSTNTNATEKFIISWRSIFIWSHVSLIAAHLKSSIVSSIVESAQFARLMLVKLNLRVNDLYNLLKHIWNKTGIRLFNWTEKMRSISLVKYMAITIFAMNFKEALIS